jgi:hypothetical protein
MRVADLVVAGVLTLLAVVVLVDAVRLGTGWGTDGPKSGFFPFWLATLLLLTTGLIVVQTLLRRGTPPFLTRERAIPVLRVLVPAVVFVLLTQVIGLYVAGVLYMAVSMRWLGRHRWITVVLVSVAIPLATFVVFERWFLVPMPKGPLEHWLGY